MGVRHCSPRTHITRPTEGTIRRHYWTILYHAVEISTSSLTHLTNNKRCKILHLLLIYSHTLKLNYVISHHKPLYISCLRPLGGGNSMNKICRSTSYDIGKVSPRSGSRSITSIPKDILYIGIRIFAQTFAYIIHTTPMYHI